MFDEFYEISDVCTVLIRGGIRERQRGGMMMMMMVVVVMVVVVVVVTAAVVFVNGRLRKELGRGDVDGDGVRLPDYKIKYTISLNKL